jgi:hypothetical protein
MQSYFRRLGELQAEMLLALLYVIVGGPVWLLTRLTRTSLLDGPRAGWHDRRDETGSVDRMREPF